MTKVTTTPTTDGMRRCIGSTAFGIGAHEAPVDEFPVQASGRDGLGRMCRPHWTEYTRALRRASVARRAEAEAMPEAVAGSATPTSRRSRRARAASEPEVVTG